MPIRIVATPAVCPGCRSEIAWRHVRLGQSFACPSCRTRLMVRRAYMWTLNVTGAVIALFLAYAIGLRDWWLLVAGFLGMIPIQAIVMLITLRLFSVEFEPTGEVRDILYPTERPTADVQTVLTDAPRQARIGIRLWEFFEDINQPRSVEGYALQAGIVVMAVFVGWMCALPLLRSVFPEFDAIRSGPTGFPVTVHIGESTLAVTNGSDVSWTCRAELGDQPLAGAFEARAGTTTQISLARFDPSGGLDRSQIRKAAQDRIWLVCDEPSGISHSAWLH